MTTGQSKGHCFSHAVGESVAVFTKEGSKVQRLSTVIDTRTATVHAYYDITHGDIVVSYTRSPIGMVRNVYTANAAVRSKGISLISGHGEATPEALARIEGKDANFNQSTVRTVASGVARSIFSETQLGNVITHHPLSYAYANFAPNANASFPEIHIVQTASRSLRSGTVNSIIDLNEGKLTHVRTLPAKETTLGKQVVYALAENVESSMKLVIYCATTVAYNAMIEFVETELTSKDFEHGKSTCGTTQTIYRITGRTRSGDKASNAK